MASNKRNRNRPARTLVRPWMILQKVGWGLILALPVTIAVVGFTKGWTLYGPEARAVTTMLMIAAIVLLGGGAACIWIGHTKCRELREHKIGKHQV
jgi:hypothetical protein